MRLAQRLWSRHAALIVTLASLWLWSAWQLHRPLHPYGDLSGGTFTDHFSHLTTTRLFPRVGIDIWRRPIREHGRPLTESEARSLPRDIPPKAANREVFAVDGWPIEKPIVASWTHLPRLHPPGDLVLIAPVALLYSFTPISFTFANRLLILSFLIYAHVSLFFYFQAWLTPRKGSAVGLLTLLVVYGEVLHWTFEGFYEAAVLAPLFLCAKWLHERRMLAAIVAYTVATTIHFRAFFFAPWVVYAAFSIVSDGSWKTWRGRDVGAALVAGLLAAATLFVFALVWPTLSAMPIVYSPLAFSAGQATPPALSAYLVVLVIVGAAFAYSRAWMDLVILAWLTFIFVRLHEAYEWDLVALLAWLGSPLGSPPKRAAMARDARLYFVLFCGATLFRSTLAPVWLAKIF
ncbi:MAG: hypothetical protein ABIP89_06520 [Polyangiaceae bacterium]